MDTERCSLSVGGEEKWMGKSDLQPGLAFMRAGRIAMRRYKGSRHRAAIVLRLTTHDSLDRHAQGHRAAGGLVCSADAGAGMDALDRLAKQGSDREHGDLVDPLLRGHADRVRDHDLLDDALPQPLD